tara:strand:+ start:97 stop:633 length:537 start_codon:yes stop_codon:yes gene_type:complete
MFCIKCGFETKILCPEGDNRERDVCQKCRNIHYTNPKIIVGILPVEKSYERILLCRRNIEPGYGKWTIPAGFMEMNESIEEGAKREALEEANLKINILKLYSTFNTPNIGHVYLFYLGEILNEDYAPMDETLEVKLYRLSEIPWNEIAFSSVDFILRKYIDDFNDGKSFKFHSNYIGK